VAIHRQTPPEAPDISNAQMGVAQSEISRIENRQQLADGLGSLETVGARILGVVLNRISHKHAGSYSYSYYDYASASGSGAKVKKRHKHEETPGETQQRPTPTTTPR
jgi:hypothetical protein